MLHYHPPLRDQQFLLHEVFRAVPQLRACRPYADLDADTLDAVLRAGGRFATDVVLPLNMPGDRQGCAWRPDTAQVHTPDGFAAAYAQYVAAGWPALGCAPEHGGQGLPAVANQCLYEMLNSVSQAWTMYPGLSHGAYACLEAHGTPEQKACFLPKLTSGEWTGTMCLTEPHCGTDLGLLTTRAEPDDSGHYRLYGQKIFISAGEHDLARNIVHLVLARLPGGGAGSKGISLFVVSQHHLLPDGALGARNAIRCAGIEHKMGLHGSATCHMVLDGAHASLVGRPHQGLQAMFVMMNAARLGVGNQSLGLTEIAHQNALAYARQRLQMRSLRGPQSPQQSADPILVHPDVRRMLLTARAYAEGGRALQVWCALLLDLEKHHPDLAVRQDSAAELAWLTPVAKAFLTDNGWDAVVLCQQVLGGHGYIRDSGMEQLVRDARVNTVYEGTNGVQGLDLLLRKVLADRGQVFQAWVQKVKVWLASLMSQPGMGPMGASLGQVLDRLCQATALLAERSQRDPEEAGAAATDYLRLTGHVVFAYLFARMATVAQQRLDEAGANDFYQAKLDTARFYFAKLLPETLALEGRIQAGAACLNHIDHAGP